MIDNRAASRRNDGNARKHGDRDISGHARTEAARRRAWLGLNDETEATRPRQSGRDRAGH